MLSLTLDSSHNTKLVSTCRNPTACQQCTFFISRKSQLKQQLEIQTDMLDSVRGVLNVTFITHFYVILDASMCFKLPVTWKICLFILPFALNVQMKDVRTASDACMSTAWMWACCLKLFCMIKCSLFIHPWHKKKKKHASVSAVCVIKHPSQSVLMSHITTQFQDKRQSFILCALQIALFAFISCCEWHVWAEYVNKTESQHA